MVPLLATATLLQLDGVIDQCVAIMEETVNAQVIYSNYIENVLTMKLSSYYLL